MSVERGTLLMQTGRHELAEQEFRSALGQEPSNAFAHAMLAMCLLQREKYHEATDEAREAIQLRPDWSLGFAVMARIMLKRRRLKEAAEAVRQAIQYDPFNPANYALQAGIHLDLRNWPAALDSAGRGLQIEPDNADCLNLRAVALVKLGRREEAGQTITGALNKDPENATTHANQGWALLHAGDHKQALIHFREALRLEPELEWAKAGLVEALKARNIVYRLMLKYFLFMSRLSKGAQWGIILGGYIGFRGLRALSANNPDLAPWISPIIIAYVVFALATWISRPLFNLLLRLDRFGKYALSRDQVHGANCVGLTLLAAIGFGIAALVTGNGALLLPALVFGLLVMPVSAIYSCESGWPRLTMLGYTIAVGAVGATLCVGLFRHWDAPDADGIRDGSAAQLIQGLTTAFYIGILMSAFVANSLVMARAKK